MVVTPETALASIKTPPLPNGRSPPFVHVVHGQPVVRWCSRRSYKRTTRFVLASSDDLKYHTQVHFGLLGAALVKLPGLLLPGGEAAPWSRSAPPASRGARVRAHARRREASPAARSLSPYRCALVAVCSTFIDRFSTPQARFMLITSLVFAYFGIPLLFEDPNALMRYWEIPGPRWPGSGPSSARASRAGTRRKRRATSRS